MLLLCILLCVFALYLVQDLLYRKYWKKGLRVTLSTSHSRARQGEKVELYETVENRKLLPLPLVHIKFITDRSFWFADEAECSTADLYYRNDLLSVLSWQKLTRRLKFTCTKRGYFSIRDLTVTCGNLFLETNLVEHFSSENYVYVHPRLIDPTVFDPAFREMYGSALTKRCINEDPFEFRSIREYQSYDDRKAVNWKASAKTGALKVTTHDYTAMQQVRILLNLEPISSLRYDHLFEEAISLAATAAATFLDKGVTVSLTTNGKDIVSKSHLFVPEGSGSGHIVTMNDTLARIDLNQDANSILPLCTQLVQSTRMQDYLIIISPGQQPALQDLLRTLPGKTDSFTWILPIEPSMEIKVAQDLQKSLVPWYVNK